MDWQEMIDIEDRDEISLEDVRCSPWDGKNRLVEDSDEILPDGEIWGIVSDHGNVEFCIRGEGGDLTFLGGIV